MENQNSKKIIRAVIPLIIAIISITVLSKYAASADFHANTIASLDDKKTTVMELTAASAGASAAITLLPGDTATPIASELANLSSYFLLVICAIYIEKYLVTITGYAAFSVLIPIACVLLSVNVFIKENTFKYLAAKLIAFGIAIALVIPASVAVSNSIEATYNSSIETTIEAARQATKEIEGSADENTDETAQESFSDFITKVKDKVTEATTGAAAKFENVLNKYIEALAVMLVTSCVIPVVVLLFFVWLVKSLLSIHIDFTKERIVQNEK